MKKEFSSAWVGSSQTRKQRKYRYNAPLHLRHKMISANLSKELRKSYGKRNIPLRKDDEVKIMVGEFKGKKGKVESIDLKKLKLKIAGIFRTKKDGSKIAVIFDPSNLQIIELNLSDKKRKEALERKGSEKKTEKAEKKTEKKEIKTEKKTQTKKTKEIK